MSISSLGGDLRTIKHLVSWPEAITELEFEPLSMCHYDSTSDINAWGLQQLMPILTFQKDKLRRLSISRLPLDNTGLSGFSVADFPYLEELNLSYWSTGSQVAEQANLLAPRLRKLTWSFNIDGMIDGMGCHPCEFGEAEEMWVRSMMRTAMAKKSRLRHVHIDFYPYFEGYSFDAATVVYPWDRIDALAKEFEVVGMRLTCESNGASQIFKSLWRPPGYVSPSPPPRTPLPEPGAHLPGYQSDSESVVSLDGEGQRNKITTYFERLPVRPKIEATRST